MGRGTLIETDLTEEKKDSSENDQSNNDREDQFCWIVLDELRHDPHTDDLVVLSFILQNKANEQQGVLQRQ